MSVCVCVCVIQCYGTTEPETEKSNANLLLKTEQMELREYEDVENKFQKSGEHLQIAHSRFSTKALWLYSKQFSFAIILRTVVVEGGGEKKSFKRCSMEKKIGTKERANS